MRRQDAIAAMIAAQVKPKTHIDSVETLPSSSAYCGVLDPESLSRTRDRQQAESNRTVEAPAETLYENEVRHFGKYWADQYRAQREETAKAELDAAKTQHIRAQRAAEDARRREAREAYAQAERQRQEQVSTTILANKERTEVLTLLRGESAAISNAVIERMKATGMHQPFAVQAFIEEEKEREHGTQA